MRYSGNHIISELYRWRTHGGVLICMCCCSVAKSCPTFWNAVNCRTPGFPVLHYLPEFAQTCVHWVGDATQPSHPLSSPSPPAFNLSQHQGLLQESEFQFPLPARSPLLSTLVWGPLEAFSSGRHLPSQSMWPFLASMFFLWGWVSFHHSLPSEVLNFYSFFKIYPAH